LQEEECFPPFAYEGPLFAPGYWSAPMLVDCMPVLLRGRDTWMSITPLGTPDYPARLDAAARRWVRGRWLPGTPPPC
jgi:hypothetical protein